MSADMVLMGAMDFGLMSILLVIAHLLRSRLKLLQNAFIPSSIIAGILGLVGGWQFLDWLPFSMAATAKAPLPAMAGYPGFLIVIIFATLFMGRREGPRTSIGTLTKSVGDTFFYNLASLIGMYGLALLFGVLVLERLFPDLHSGFAMMLPVGFVGGHGTASAVGDFFAQSETGQWAEALTIGNTFATVGILAAVFGGMLIINVATRRGWTRVVKSAGDMPASLKKGFVPDNEQVPMGRETVNSLALDPLTWHIALVLIAFAVAYYVKDLAGHFLSEDYVIPAFCLSLLAGALLQKLLDLVRLGEYVDRRIMVRIGSSVADYLIAFGVASIQIKVVIAYAGPLAIMILFGIVFCVGLFWFVGRKIFRNFWFERSIFVYGWNTGVTGFAIMLLRVVDPKMKTPTLGDFGLAYLFISVAEIGTITVIPMLVAGGHILVPGIVLALCFLGCIFLSRYLVGWFSQPADALREGEEEVIAGSGE
ncbi:MAG: sodium/glutamate symporter [Planctomycetota bacterium]|jgi:ESS family glutamate:Na+ symporter